MRDMHFHCNKVDKVSSRATNIAVAGRRNNNNNNKLVLLLRRADEM